MNPYTERLARAEEALRQAEAEQTRQEKNAIPGTFITGRSGVPQSRIRRLERQMDKTIDMSVRLCDLRAEVRWLQTCEALFDDGKINEQGRSIRPKNPNRARRPASGETRLRLRVDEEMWLNGVALVGLNSLHCLVGYITGDEPEPLGIIRVVSLEGKETDHYAESIQMVHLEKTWRWVALDLHRKGSD